MKRLSPRQFRPRAVAAGVLGALGAAGGALTLAAFFGTQGWRWELLTHFRLQYGLGLAALALGLAALRSGRAAAACALLAGVNLAPITPYYFSLNPAPPAAAPRLKMLFLNAQITNFRFAAVGDLMAAESPDVVALAEVSSEWLEALRGATAAYPFRLERPGSHGFGIAVYSRVPWESAQQIPLPPLNAATLAVKMPLGGAPLSLLFTHLVSPDSPEGLRVRNGQLENLARWARAQPPPVLIMGDLNTSPFSPYFQKLLRDAGLRDSARGLGWQPTWPSFAPWFFIPIDHALVGPGLVVVERHVGPDVGSDHRPIIVTVAVAP